MEVLASFTSDQELETGAAVEDSKSTVVCEARLNHVTMSMLPEQLDAKARADINRFFGDVFGWSENRYLSAPGSALVLGRDEAEPLVFLLEHAEAMMSPGHDHFALGVEGIDELKRVEARAMAFAATDDRTTVLEHNIDDYGVAKLHNIFIRFLIPLLIEVQYLELVDVPGFLPNGDAAVAAASATS